MTKRMRQLVERYQRLSAKLDDVMILRETGWSASALTSIKAAMKDMARKAERVKEEKAAVRETAAILRREEKEQRETLQRQEILRRLEMWAPETKDEFRHQWLAGTALSHLSQLVAMPETDLPLLAKELGLTKKQYGSRSR